MSNQQRLLIGRIAADEIISASKLLNPLVDGMNTLLGAQTLRMNSPAWYRCRSSVNADPYSVLGVSDIEIDHEGVTIVAEEVDQTHEHLIANEENRLVANETGWCKIVNDRDLALVRVYAPLSNPIVYLDELVVYQKQVVLPTYASMGSGSGSGSGTGGVTPSCDLWAMSDVLTTLGSGSGSGSWDGDGSSLVYVQAGKNPRALLFQSTGGPGGNLIYGSHSATRYVGQFRLVNREDQTVDTTRTFEVNCRDIEALVFPRADDTFGTPMNMVSAELQNGRYYAISGGTKHFFGTAVGSSSPYSVTPSASIFGSCETLSNINSMFGESFLNGSGVLGVVISNRLYLIASDCDFGSGSGSGS